MSMYPNCIYHVFQAARNCSELLEIIPLTAVTSLKMEENKMCIMLDNVALSLFRKPLKENNKWRVSYLSGLNFTENKRGFPYYSLKEPIILPVTYLASKQRRLLHTWYAKMPHSSNTQIRTFKSQRSIKMELEQNPTLMSKIKKWLGLSSNLHAV